MECPVNGSIDKIDDRAFRKCFYDAKYYVYANLFYVCSKVYRNYIATFTIVNILLSLINFTLLYFY